MHDPHPLRYLRPAAVRRRGGAGMQRLSVAPASGRIYLKGSITMEQMIKFRTPTPKEWCRLMDVVDADDAKTHWSSVCSWACSDAASRHRCECRHPVCGVRTPYCYLFLSDMRVQDRLGFRPAFDSLPSGCCPSSLEDGESAAAVTLYMNGIPVKVPQDPTRGGDIEDYVPHSKLTFGPAINDPAYAVTVIKAGSVFIADRVLLKNIAYPDIERSITDAVMSTASIVAFPPSEAESPKSIIDILNFAARTLGYDITPKTTYDGTRIRVAQNMRDIFRRFYAFEDFDVSQAKLLADIQVDETLADYEIAVGDDFIYKSATIHEILEDFLKSEPEEDSDDDGYYHKLKKFADTLWGAIDDNRSRCENSRLVDVLYFGRNVLDAYVNNNIDRLIFTLSDRRTMYELLNLADLLPEDIEIK